mmetsp:Transcript_88090/g.235693  ORF Transcript_88090/g.235693 Transcript_88090/m.235693 type:complete len:281 (-) Transcript_88090:21-863(-)
MLRAGRHAGRAVRVGTRHCSVSISVHRGHKLQAALVVGRPPSVVVTPDHLKSWRDFERDWKTRTQNGVEVEDNLVFMKMQHEFLEQMTQAQVTASLASSEEKAELQELLSGEGLDLDFSLEDDEVQQDSGPVADTKVVSKDKGLRAMDREATKHLFLVVQDKRGRWQFPIADRLPDEGMRSTLESICDSQLGAFEPYLVGMSPVAFEKRAANPDGAMRKSGLEGRKVFYYRAHAVPGRPNVDISGSTQWKDFAWMTREELKKSLSLRKWAMIRDVIPLDP